MSQVLAKKASSSVRNPKNNSDKKRTKSRGKDPDVDQAMSKLREHAERLGVSERDLVQAMSNPSHPANNLMKNNKKDLLAMQKHDHRGQTRY